MPAMKNRKPVLGILAFLPIVLTLIFMGWYLNACMGMFMTAVPQNGRAPDPAVLLPQMAGIFRMVLLMMIPGLAVYITSLVLFIRDLISRTGIRDGERAIWMAAMVLAAAIAFPVYYFLYVFPDKSRDMPGQVQ